MLTPEQYKEVKELGILVDKDDQVGAARGITQRHAQVSMLSLAS